MSKETIEISAHSAPGVMRTLRTYKATANGLLKAATEYAEAASEAAGETVLIWYRLTQVNPKAIRTLADAKAFIASKN